MTIHFPSDTFLTGGTRPEGHPEHIPYVCIRTGAICLDRLPVTQAEVKACSEALEQMHAVNTATR